MRSRYLALGLAFSLAFFCHQAIASDWKALLDEADSLCKSGLSDSAITLGKLALDDAERRFGKVDTVVALVLRHLGEYYSADRNYLVLEPLCKRIISIYEEVFGYEHEKTGQALHTLASVYLDLCRHAEAEPLFLQAISILEKTIGRDRWKMGYPLTGLANVYRNNGRYVEAESCCVRALDIWEKAYGEGDPHVAMVLYNLSAIYEGQGKFPEAEVACRRALAIRRAAWGTDNTSTATCIERLAAICESQGRYTEAEPLFRQVLDIRERIFGPNDIAVARSLEYLGRLEETLGDFAAAESLLVRSLAITEHALGQDNPTIAFSMNRIAELYLRRGEYDMAEPLVRRALKLREESFGPDHLYTSYSMRSLGNLCFRQGKYQEAERYMQMALRIQDSLVGTLHPFAAGTWNDLAVLYATSGRYEESLECYNRLVNSRQRFLEHVFASSSENQKLQWIRRHPLIENSFLSFALLCNDPEAVNSALTMVLRGKSAVIDAVMNENVAAYCSFDEDVLRKLNERADICTQIADLALRSDTEEFRNACGDSMEVLCRLQDSLEAELSHICSRYGDKLATRQVGVPEVAGALAKKSALWEIVRYEPYDFLRTGGEDERICPARYLAFVLSRSKQIELVDLGEAEEIDSLVSLCREMIYRSGPRVYSAEAAHCEQELAEASSKLYDMVFAPLAAHSNGKTDLYIAPDGALNLLPFEILPEPDGPYVIERYRISYLSSGRDLATFGREIPIEPEGAIIVADPDFDRVDPAVFLASGGAPDSLMVIARATLDLQRGVSGCLGAEFPRLRYSRRESMSIAQILREKGGLQVGEYYGVSAAEEILKAISRSPRILHLATHGFVCQDTSYSSYGVASPLLRSGLVLAGANRIIADRDADLAQGEDGILTAYEVSGLNLVGTEVAVLSACETGVGEIVYNEGVFGLRRAFQHAGVRSVLMSLWTIPDKLTSELMQGFFDRWLGGMTKRDALREAALEIIRRCRVELGSAHPFLWGGFVLTGDPK